MSEVHRRAMVARALQDNPAFVEICDEIKAQAGELFFNPASGIDAIAGAHERIRAIAIFQAAIGDRIADQVVMDKKAQDRERND